MPVKITVDKIGQYTGHRDSIYTLCAGPSMHEFYSAGGDGLAVRWNTNQPDTGWPAAKAEKSVYALAYDAAEGKLWVAENYHGLHVIDTVAGREQKNLQLTDAPIFDILLAGKTGFLCTGDGKLMAFNTIDFSLSASVALSGNKLRCLAVHPSGTMLAVAGSDKNINILSLPDLKIVHTITQAHRNSIFTCAFSPCGRFLLTGGRDAALKVWNAKQDFELLESIPAHLYCINHISFSTCGNYFATCSMDKSVKVWSAKTYDLLKVIDKARHAGHGTSVNKLLWPGAPGVLVSTGDDRNISVWKITEHQS